MGISIILVIISTILIGALILSILKIKNRSQLQNVFIINLALVFIISFGVLWQHWMSSSFGANPKPFESFIYIGTCFLPVSIFFTGLIYTKTKINFKKRYLWLFIIPIISLILLWTDDIHHLFYTYYSINMSEVIPGPAHKINTLYSYTLIFIGVLYLLIYSIKNQGLFSKQSFLILLGISVPVIVNFLGTFKIIPMNVFVTPISFSISVILFTFAIIRFQFLGVSPIALQSVVDRISDSFVVLNDNYSVIDFNQTFLKTFNIKAQNLRGKNFISFLKSKKLKYAQISDSIAQAKKTTKTISFQEEIPKISKTFQIEINEIYSDGSSLGTLILFKDITQHVEDMKRIQETQDRLMESERLSSLGQLIGGIAHNLKTPIMSISGATEGLSDLIQEYDSSIDDPEVTKQDHHDIAKDMNDWISKIRNYTSYMSDIITAVKGQAVTLSETEYDYFDVDELVKRVDILMKHELKNAFITMNTSINVPKDTKIHGDINSLVQVINNLISNAIQSYNGEQDKIIDLIINSENNNLIISVKDYGCGLSDIVKEKLFKEMVTTKGKNGTGLGLYMSYSTIKANFNGDITYESEIGKGTTFNVTIPLQ